MRVCVRTWVGMWVRFIGKEVVPGAARHPRGAAPQEGQGGRRVEGDRGPIDCLRTEGAVGDGKSGGRVCRREETRGCGGCGGASSVVGACDGHGMEPTAHGHWHWHHALWRCRYNEPRQMMVNTQQLDSRSRDTSGCGDDNRETDARREFCTIGYPSPLLTAWTITVGHSSTRCQRATLRSVMRVGSQPRRCTILVGSALLAPSLDRLLASSYRFGVLPRRQTYMAPLSRQASQL